MDKGYMFYDDEIANSEQRICSLAYILCDNNGNILSEVNQKINPECDFSRWSKRNLELAKEDLSAEPTIKEFCEQSDFLAHLSNNILVGHNCSGADLHHIRKSLKAYNIKIPEIECIDTMKYARRLGYNGSLEEACRKLGIQNPKKHDAYCDAVACMNLFKALQKLSNNEQKPVPWDQGSRNSNNKISQKRDYNGAIGFVHGTDMTIEEYLERSDIKNLRVDIEGVHEISGLKFLVTGKIPGNDRKSIAIVLEGKDALVAKSVRNCDYLVVGDNAGKSKFDDAVKYDKKIMTSYDLLKLLDNF